MSDKLTIFFKLVSTYQVFDTVDSNDVKKTFNIDFEVATRLPKVPVKEADYLLPFNFPFLTPLVEETTEIPINIENLDATDLEKKIIRQIEFYFGDFNLPRDKFMLEVIDHETGCFYGVGMQLILPRDSTKTLRLFSSTARILCNLFTIFFI